MFRSFIFRPSIHSYFLSLQLKCANTTTVSASHAGATADDQSRAEALLIDLSLDEQIKPTGETGVSAMSSHQGTDLLNSIAAPR